MELDRLVNKNDKLIFYCKNEGVNKKNEKFS